MLRRSDYRMISNGNNINLQLIKGDWTRKNAGSERSSGDGMRSGSITNFGMRSWMISLTKFGQTAEVTVAEMLEVTFLARDRQLFLQAWLGYCSLTITSNGMF